MQVLPAILVQKPSDFVSQVQKLSEFYTHFQIDLADGQHVPNTTITLDEVSKAIDQLGEDLRKKLTFDFDLMLVDYQTAIERIDEIASQVRVNAIFPRPGYIKNYSELLSLYPDFEIGLALDPPDSVETIVQLYDIQKIPAIQIMTVSPGFQGGEFLEDMLNKIDQLRMNDYRNKIYLDGGINDRTLPKILECKNLPDAVGIGSYLTAAADVKKHIDKLSELIPQKEITSEAEMDD